MAKIKAFFGAINAKLSAFWATKTGKIVLILALVLVTNFFSGGVGNMVGCARQAKKTTEVSDELKNSTKALKDANEKLAGAEKELARLKLNKKCK
jgi:hypothetical protein